ncbi:MAG: type II toxin-antitoxin system VapC family toxin [Bacteroidota bacterium]
MRVLLDTHTFLWFIGGDARLSGYARSLITDPATTRLLSVASLWAMSIKVRLGRLRLGFAFPELVERQVRGNGIDLLPIRPAHLDEVARLPLHHRDPFDRLVIAQAVVEGMPVVSRDGEFGPYPATVLWDEP